MSPYSFLTKNITVIKNTFRGLSRMPKNPSIYTSHTKAKDAFIRDIQQHRNYIRSAFNQYGT